MRLSHRRKVASKNCPADPRRQQLITWQRRNAFHRAWVYQIHQAFLAGAAAGIADAICYSLHRQQANPPKLSFLERIKTRMAGWYGSLQSCLD